MQWNWQQQDWPNFSYKSNKLEDFERALQHQSGLLFGAYLHLTPNDKDQLRVELVSNEALKTSEIEGEYLNRDSLQSSIRRHFGLQTDARKIAPAERGIADLMMDGQILYTNVISIFWK